MLHLILRTAAVAALTLPMVAMAAAPAANTSPVEPARVFDNL